jgi:rRNA-processing protein FCF1
MSETNKAIYRRAWMELMNQHNLDIAEALFALNYVLHDPHIPSVVARRLNGSPLPYTKDFPISGSPLMT